MGEIVNYSLKIDSEVKNSLLTKINESNLTAGEFISSLLSHYEVTQNQESLFDVRELQQMENHLIRVKEIYIGLAKRLKDEETNHQLTREKLQEEIKTAQADKLTVAANAEKELETAKNKIAELEKELLETQKKEQQAQDLASTSTAILKTQQAQIDYLQNEAAKLRNELTNTKLEQSQQTKLSVPEMVTSGLEEIILENTPEPEQATAIPPDSQIAASENSPDYQTEELPLTLPISPKAKQKSSKKKKNLVDIPLKADEQPTDNAGEKNSI